MLIAFNTYFFYQLAPFFITCTLPVDTWQHTGAVKIHLDQSVVTLRCPQVYDRYKILVRLIRDNPTMASAGKENQNVVRNWVSVAESQSDVSHTCLHLSVRLYFIIHFSVVFGPFATV
jgi:hypothetical protein